MGNTTLWITPTVFSKEELLQKNPSFLSDFAYKMKTLYFVAYVLVEENETGDDGWIKVILGEANIYKFFDFIETYILETYQTDDPYSILDIEVLEDVHREKVKAYIESYNERMVDKMFAELEKRLEEREETIRNSDIEARNQSDFDFPVNFSPEMTAYIKELRHVTNSLYAINSLEQFYAKQLLISMDDGWGYSAFLRAIREELVCFYNVKAKNITLEEMSISTENGVAAWSSVPKIIKEFSEKVMANGKFGILAYDMRNWMDAFSNPVFLNELRRMGQYAKHVLLVFRIPYMDQKVIRKIEQNVSNVLSVRSIVVPPISTENMVLYLKNKLWQAHFFVGENCDDLLEQWICQEKNEGHFYGYKTLDKMAGELIYYKALHDKESAFQSELVICIQPEDVQTMLTDVLMAEDAYQLFNDMIGMAQIKTKVQEIVAQIKLQKSLEEQGKIIEKPTMHMMFLGNPGTGKTTVARIIGQIFKQEGLLRKGHFIEKTGNGFVERFVGATIQNVRSTCRDAYGSVLFIDEAYGMNIGTSSGNTTDEIVPILIAEMENHRDDMCVIFAGYKDEMKEFLKSNAGLESRISHVIEFPNYTKEELIEIFFRMVDGTFTYEDTFKEMVMDYIQNIPDETFQTKEFSNGRMVRNLYEHVWGKAAYRMSVAGEQELCLKKEDIVSVIEEEDFSTIMGEKSKQKIGFIMS